MKFSGAAHSTQSIRHFTSANRDKRLGDLCLRVGHGPVVAEYGGSCPHVRVLHILSSAWLALYHVLPREHQENAVCLEHSLVSTVLTTVTSTISCAWYKGYRKGTLRFKAPHWSDSYSHQSLGSAPTIFKLRTCRLQGVGWAFFSTIAYILATPTPDGQMKGAVSTSDHTEMQVYKASPSHRLRLLCCAVLRWIPSFFFK